MKWLSVKLEKVAGIQGGFAFKSADFIKISGEENINLYFLLYL